VFENLVCRVEIPKGTRNKYEFDAGLNAIKLDRFLFSSVVYPSDYGYLPDTLAQDGDPLDVLVLVSEPTFPGCLIEFRAVALLCMHDEKGRDDKIVGVPLRDPNWQQVTSLDTLSGPLRAEITHFFSIYKSPEGKHVQIDGWGDHDRAQAVIDAARQRFLTDQ
jgi:inorganic pyrophosphatase